MRFRQIFIIVFIICIENSNLCLVEYVFVEKFGFELSKSNCPIQKLDKGANVMRDANKTIGNIIDKASVAIISSIDENGFPNTKAMLPPRKRNGISEIYLTTNTSSMRVKQYLQNSNACVYFYDKRFFKGVMLKGKMEVLQDQESKNMIWREGDEMYYPLGVTDPDYSVLKFLAFEGRYYSNFKSETFQVVTENCE